MSSSSSSACAQIDPDDFHSDSARRYTRREVRKLVMSPEMAAFAEYTHERDSLLAVAFIAPLFLLACFYCDLVFGLMMDQQFRHIVGSAIRSTANDAPLVRGILRCLMSGFVLPCAVLVPFCGVFRDVSKDDMNVLLVVLSAVVMLLTEQERVVSAQAHGGPTGLNVGLVAVVFEGIASVVAQCGYLVAAYIVGCWRSMYWKRAVRIPMQMITVPLLVGVFGWAWNRYAALALVGSLPSQEASRSQLMSAIAEDWTFVWNCAMIRGSGEALDAALDRLSGVSAAAAANVWSTQCFVGWICIMSAVVSTHMTRLVTWVSDYTLPSHPTGLLFHGVGVTLAVTYGASLFTPLMWLLILSHCYSLASVEWSPDI